MATFLPGVTDAFAGPAPFEPDFQFIDTMLRRRQAMYEQGYSQVSNAYRALNRNLTNPNNANNRDKFVRQAEVNLKNLSSMDLSMPQNVDAANNVFKPFYQNLDILADMSLTTHWDKQESIADMYRTKDGGKEYSDDNIQYVRMQRNKFATDDPGNWRKYMQSKRSYTPFYDWNKELMEYMKDYYKPNVMDIKRRNGMYNITEVNKGASPEDLKLFFTSVASEKAKKQMMIEAAVRIGDNAADIAPIYQKVAEKELKTLEEQVPVIETRLKLASTDEERESLKNARKLYTDEIDTRKKELDKIKNGDIGFIEANPNKYAFSLYFDEAVGRLAKGLSWKDYKYDFDGDDVTMMYYRESQEWARTIYSNKRADARAAAKAERKKKEEEDKYGPPDVVNTPDFNNRNIPQQGLSIISDGLNDIQMKRVALGNELKQHVARILRVDPNTLTPGQVYAYIGSVQGKRDSRYAEIQNEIFSLEQDEKNLKGELDNVRRYAKEKIGDYDYKRVQATFKSLDPLGKKQNVTADQMFSAVVAGRVNYKEEGTGGDPRYQIGMPMKSYLTINGVSYVANKNSDLYKMYEKVKALAANPIVKGYSAAINDYFGSEQRMIGKGLKYNPNDPRFKKMAGTVSGLIGVDQTKIASITKGTGNEVYFQLDSDAANKDWENEKERIIATATQQGINIKVDDKTKTFYISDLPGISQVNLGGDIYANFTPMEKKLIDFGEERMGDGAVSSKYFPGNIMYDSKGTRVLPFHFEVFKDSNGTKRFYLYNDAYDQAIKSGTSLPDLISYSKDIANSYTRFLQSIQQSMQR